jgi:hypothetical protein
MNLIISVCFALAGSAYQDHCREELVPLHSATPQTCYLRAQEVIAEKSPLWDGESITGFRCTRRMN